MTSSTAARPTHLEPEHPFNPVTYGGSGLTVIRRDADPQVTRRRGVAELAGGAR